MRSALQQSSLEETMNGLLCVRQDKMKVVDVLGVEKG